MRFNGLSERIAYYNQELTEDVDFWYDHQGYKDSGKKGLKTTLKVCASEDNEKFGPEALQAIRKAYTDYGTSDETLREERKDAAERLEWLGHDFNGIVAAEVTVRVPALCLYRNPVPV